MQYTMKLWLFSLRHYVWMCLFQSSPSNLPYHRASIVLTLLAYVAVGFYLLGDQRDLISIVVQIGIEAAILYAISLITLKKIKKPERLLQTLSALIGVNLVISLASIPVFELLPPIVEEQQLDPLSLQVNLALLIWNLSVISLVFKRAFNIHTILAGFLAFNYFLLYRFILLSLFQ